MNRLTKKCMIASAGMHALLLVVLMVGSAFTSNKVETMPPVITLVNAIITDGPTRPAGNPNVQEPPPAAAPEQAAAAAQPPQREPERQPEPEPEPPRPEPPQVVKQPDPPKIKQVKEPDVEIPKISKVPVKDSFTLTRVNTKTPKTADKTADTKAKPEFQLNKTTRNTTANTKTSTSPKGTSTSKQNDISKQIGSSIGKFTSNIRGTAAGSTSVENPGQSGVATVNYRHLITAIYERAYDSAVTKAGEIGDRDDSVDVSVVIGSSGRVISSRITRNSGNPALNKLVQRMLDGVDSVPGFPEGARDAQRTFNIKFDLKSRRLNG